MGRKVSDCRDMPSDAGCTLTIAGEEEEVVRAAAEHGVSVHGELWAVDDALLARLDEYEGVPELFTREAVAVADHFGPVQAYFFNGAVPADAPCGDRWPLPV